MAFTIIKQHMCLKLQELEVCLLELGVMLSAYVSVDLKWIQPTQIA